MRQSRVFSVYRVRIIITTLCGVAKWGPGTYVSRRHLSRKNRRVERGWYKGIVMRCCWFFFPLLRASNDV
jgi:hypothetical protein